MFHQSFKILFWQNFTSIRQGVEYFHVNKMTVSRCLDGTVPINPMAEKLLLIKALGYLPIMVFAGLASVFVKNEL